MIKEIAKIIYYCCEQFGVSSDLICSKSKRGEVSDLRKKILYYLHEDKHLSYSVLSRVFDRNPRTVRRAIEITRHRLKYERHFREEYNCFFDIVKGASDLG
jgi:chromosomal replication initiation ATPase DnaA